MGVRQDDKLAMNWFKRAAEQGQTDAQFMVGSRHDQGKGVPQNFQEAAKWYHKAAEKGYALAQFNLGALYANGEGVPFDNITAYAWSSLAANQGQEGAAKNRDSIAKGFTPKEISQAQALAAELQAKIDNMMN